MRTFDFTPDPKVLIALTETPMKPIDALCELIDNAIDSFHIAEIKGIKIGLPYIGIELPSQKDVNNGTGTLRVIDNGPGMSAEDAEKAIKAGYSSNNRYDSLGLFGMGFNISTGKIGNRTRLCTATRESSTYLKTTIDLREISSTRNYDLVAEELPKDQSEPFGPNTSGTIIEISDWWPQGTSNHGFISKLLKNGMNRIREELGRRYATYLRQSKIRISVNGVLCEPFNFCVWSSSRFVTRNKERIPARFDFNTVLASSRRCIMCNAIVPDDAIECPECGSTQFRTIDERIKGWVGIQRYDSTTDFGIDLIRNGRVIRKYEQDAFFTFTDDFGNTVRDYPIDGPYGRIVGEVEMDFVPVDFMKQDFNRTSAEWSRAIEFLRGRSSLQPKQPGASENNSPIFKLYQGYRRVRTAGTADMYMGYWDKESGKPKRISRDKEAEYLEKFRKGIPGYVDDTEWWKLVEEADQEPTPAFAVCPECNAQNPEGAEQCMVCGHILIGKPCINPECGETIPNSAVTCPHCGQDQRPKIVEPWTCNICGTKNPPTVVTCSYCGKAQGSVNPLSVDYLREHSKRDDSLSMDKTLINLVDGCGNQEFHFAVYQTNDRLISYKTGNRIPLVVYREIDETSVFVDATHEAFTTYGIPIRFAVASEISQSVYDNTRHELSNNPTHNLTSIAWSVIRGSYGDSLSVTSSSVKEDADRLLDEIVKRLASALGQDAPLYRDEMSQEQKKQTTNNALSNNLSFDSLHSIFESSAYLTYTPKSFILTLLELTPETFFGGAIWKVSADDMGGILDGETIEKAARAERIRLKKYLEEVISFTESPSTDIDILRVTRSSIQYLSKKMGA